MRTVDLCENFQPEEVFKRHYTDDTLKIFKHFRSFDGKGCTHCLSSLPNEDSMVIRDNLVKVSYETSFYQNVCLEDLPNNCEKHEGTRCTKCAKDFGMIYESGIVQCIANDDR